MPPQSTPGNCLQLWTDVSYPVVLAASIKETIQGCRDIYFVEQSIAEFQENAEIVFVSPWSWRAVEIPVSAIPTIAWVETIEALGVTIDRRFAVTHHVDNLLSSDIMCTNTLRLAHLEPARPANYCTACSFQGHCHSQVELCLASLVGIHSTNDRNRLQDRFQSQEFEKKPPAVILATLTLFLYDFRCNKASDRPCCCCLFRLLIERNLLHGSL